jgi:cell wall-associated NlpC family hydrolase
MITEVTLVASAWRLALWKRLATQVRQINRLAITGLIPLALVATALPAQAADTQSPPDIHLLWATQSAIQLDWSASAGATSYSYELYQMNGVPVRSGEEPGSHHWVICRGLHPGWRYLAAVWAGAGAPEPGAPEPGAPEPGAPEPGAYGGLYVTLPGINPPRELAYQWAETQAGTPYRYGAQGDGGYDCSGLVRAAYLHAGIWLPRTTGEMLQYWRLDQESSPRQGDLVFFGDGHVELYAGQDQSFGAEDNHTGTWWNRWWPSDWWPTAFYRVSTAGLTSAPGDTRQADQRGIP